MFIACSACWNLGCFQLWTRKWGWKLKNKVCCFNIRQPGNNLASPQGLARHCILLFLNIFGFCSHSHVCLQYQSHVKLWLLWYKIGFYIKLLQSFLMSLRNRMVSLRCIGRYHTETIRSAESPSLVSSISGKDKIQPVRVLHSFHSSVTNLKDSTKYPQTLEVSWYVSQSMCLSSGFVFWPEPGGMFESCIPTCLVMSSFGSKWSWWAETQQF